MRNIVWFDGLGSAVIGGDPTQIRALVVAMSMMLQGTVCLWL